MGRVYVFLVCLKADQGEPGNRELKRICVRGEKSLAVLHDRIRQAFKEEERLYYFIVDMNGEKRRYYTPLLGHEHYVADEVTVKQLNLKRGQKLGLVHNFVDQRKFVVVFEGERCMRD